MDGNGRFGGKLTARQEGFLLQLLVDGNVEAACRRANVGVTTAWRWLKEPDFRRARQEARAEQVEIAVAALQARCAQAVETLERNMSCGEPAVEVRAAAAVLRQVLATRMELTAAGGGDMRITEIVVQLPQWPDGTLSGPVPPAAEPVSVETEARRWSPLEVIVEE